MDDLNAFSFRQYPAVLLTDPEVLIIIFRVDFLDIFIIRRSRYAADGGGEYLTICTSGSGVSWMGVVMSFC